MVRTPHPKPDTIFLLGDIFFWSQMMPTICVCEKKFNSNFHQVAFTYERNPLLCLYMIWIDLGIILFCLRFRNRWITYDKKSKIWTKGKWIELKKNLFCFIILSNNVKYNWWGVGKWTKRQTIVWKSSLHWKEVMLSIWLQRIDVTN